METLLLPRLVGTREAVRDLLAEQDVSGSLAGESLVVLGRDLASGSSSFADELVVEVLERRKADHLILVGMPDQFVRHVRESAARRDVSERVSLRSGAELGV